jgi:hypothetical protein
MVTSPTSTDEVAIWDRVIQFEEQPSPTAARALLKLRFSEADQQRMHELSAKAGSGTLSPEEQRLIDTYERLGCLLDILHSKARRALKSGQAAS